MSNTKQQMTKTYTNAEAAALIPCAYETAKKWAPILGVPKFGNRVYQWSMSHIVQARKRIDMERVGRKGGKV